jgi:hypothetical protein
MGDIGYDTYYYAPVPAEQVRGLSVAGPPAEPPEDRNADRGEAVQRESAEYSDESVGRNVDVEA